ncbi:hypothetical protein Btru_061874, partial [Bulinus truncatus]
MTTNDGMGLLVHFIEINISPDRKHSDHLQVYSLFPIMRRLSPRQGIYGLLNRSLHNNSSIFDYKVVNNSLRIEYIGVPTLHYSGFKLLVSSFKEYSPTNQCLYQQLHCSVLNICINGHLVCDGDHNCGKDDPKDEIGCNREDTMTDLLDN